MTAARRTRITIERERILVLAHQLSHPGRCEKCGHEVESSKQEQVGLVLNAVSGPWDEPSQTKLHLEQAKDGLAVCLKSMLRFLKAASGRNTAH